MKIASFATSLTDPQWDLIKPLLPEPCKLGRPPTDRRKVVDAILYIVKGGIPWRLLPHCFPPWKTVYHIFRKWAKEGVWEAVNSIMRARVRAQAGKRCRPTAAILDSQSVKSDGHGGEVGYDAGKRIKGRKRHLLVDTLGLLLGVAVTPASTPEREGASLMLEKVLVWFNWLRLLWVDGGYTGDSFAQTVKAMRPKLEVQVVKRSEDLSAFQALPRRWVVERTFGWIMRHRRLVRDYEASDWSAEAWIYIAMIRIQLRRLA